MSECVEDRRRQLREYLRAQTADGEAYFKSKFVAEDLELSARVIGQLFGDLRKDARDIEIERWAYANATTWRVTRQ